jgi:protease I
MVARRIRKKVRRTHEKGAVNVSRAELFPDAMGDQRTSLVQTLGKLSGRWRGILLGIRNLGPSKLEDHGDRARHLFRRDETGRNDPDQTGFADRSRSGGRLREEPGGWLGCLADHNVLRISRWFVFSTEARLNPLDQKDQPMSESISLLKVILNSGSLPAEPWLSSAQLLDAPENKAIQDIWALPPQNPRLHQGLKVAVLATDGVEEIEISTILHYFRSRGAQVDLVSPKLPSYPTYLGIQFPGAREDHILTITYIATGGWIRFDRLLENTAGDDYDVVILPGGAWNPDTLRGDANAISFVQKAAAAGKIVAAICHGPWVISDAGLTRGKRVTGWLAIRRDLENAGATFIDEAAVTDGKIVTSRGPLDLAAFVYAIDDLIKENRR